MNTQNNYLDVPLTNDAEISMHLKKLNNEALLLKNAGGSLEEQIEAEDKLELLKSERKRVNGIVKLRAESREKNKKTRIKNAIVERDEKVKSLTAEMVKFAKAMEALKVLSQQFDNIMKLSTLIDNHQSVIGPGLNLHPLTTQSQLKRLKGALISSFGAEAMGVSPGEAIQWKDFDLLTDVDSAIKFVESNY